MRHARKDYSGIQDPSGKIPKGEPVFLLRGQDILAPMVMEFYASQADAIGCQVELVEAVRRHAEVVRDWQQRVKVKKADL